MEGEGLGPEGLSHHDAIRQACLLRFRPIMMTTLAALLGALPLALGTGPGSELRIPLGVAIVGGLIVSQVLTLFTTPVVYLAMSRFTKMRTVTAADRMRPAPTKCTGIQVPVRNAHFFPPRTAASQGEMVER